MTHYSPAKYDYKKEKKKGIYYIIPDISTIGRINKREVYNKKIKQTKKLDEAET